MMVSRTTEGKRTYFNMRQQSRAIMAPMTVEPRNITINVQTALQIARKDMGVRRNFDMVLNMTIETASLITDSP